MARCSDGRRLVWRKIFRLLLFWHATFGGGLVVIWVGHSIDYKINPISRPIAGAVGEEIIFMDDDDQPHFKRVLGKCNNSAHTFARP